MSLRQRQFAAILLGVVVAIAAIWAFVSIRFGSVRAAVAFIQSEDLLLDAGLYDMGQGKVGERRKFPVAVRNLSDRTLTVTGARSRCTCLMVEKLPLAIEPGKSVPLEVEFAFTGKPGMRQEQLWIYTDSVNTPTAAVRIQGTVFE